MKEYKVEALSQNITLTLVSEDIIKAAKAEVQAKLDEYSAQGYRLISTSSTNFGFAVYIYLFFEKDV